MRRFLVPTLLFTAFLLFSLTMAWPRWHLRPHGSGSAPQLRPTAAASGPATPVPLPSPTLNGAAAAPGSNRPTPLPPAFIAFNQWAERYLSADSAATLPVGTALAWQRRQAMLELIQHDPQKALALGVPFRWRALFSTNVTQYLEQQVDGRGDLDVAIASSPHQSPAAFFRRVTIGNQTYEAFVYGRRLNQHSAKSIPLHGIALDGKLALSEEPLRLLTAAETASLEQNRGLQPQNLCAVCGRAAAPGNSSVAAEAGGELMYFCSSEHAALVNRSWSEAETGSRLQPRLHSPWEELWTHGDKTLLYMRVNFPDDLTEPLSESDAYRDMDSVESFYALNSYEMTAINTTVAPLVTLPEPKAWYSVMGPFPLLLDAREAARQAGYDTANYDLDIVSLTSVPGEKFAWGGLAFVGGKGVWLQSFGAGVTAHELGHNYGLLHANFWDASPSGSAIGPGTNVEYGNIYDTMGNAAAGAHQFNALFKNQLDWLPETAVHNANTSGVYRLFPFDVPNRIEGNRYAAKVPKDFQKDYWLEFRQAFSGNPWLENGILLNWSPWEQSGGGSQLLDVAQNSPPGAVNLQQAALVIGRTFADSAAGVYITPLARGATGTNAWIDVQVNLGAFPGNQAPELQVEIDTNQVAPGALVHFHASAWDPDGDTLAYAWSFDDASFSTNNLPWTYKSWPGAGEHVVRCVVSDMKGGVASVNAVVTVGEPAGFHITGQVLDAQGFPVEGVRVDNFSMTNGTQLVSAWTDSNGRYLLTGITGELELAATKYGFTFTNFTWTNPLTADSNLLSIDFVAQPLPVLTVRTLMNAVVESSAGTNFFLITRSGDVASNLTVALNLSGSATVGSDFRLAPGLAAGTNSIDIPAGTDTVAIAFQTINDTLVEGAETASLTLLPDPVYVIGSLGEATVTILDDDAPVLPSVAVTTPTPRIMENGTDAGEFIFSRRGSTAADLLVYYSASGTATPGADYASLPGVLLIPAGQSQATVFLLPKDDKAVEPDETVVVTLTPNPAYNVLGTNAQITIQDDDFVTVTIFPTAAGAAEPSTPGRCTVQREGDLTANLTIGYAVAGSASPGLDYVPLSGSVTIPAGAVSADIVVTPLDDTLLEGNESVVVTLTNNVAYSIGTPGSATLFIQDRQKPTVTIVATDPSASEPGNDFGTFTISRGTVVNGALTVYLSISGTALNGIDYVPLNNSVTIPDGSSSITLDVIPFDDLHLEPTEDVVLILAPNTNYNVGDPAEARVSILDDDPYSVPAVGFTFAASSAPENQSPGISVSLSYTSAQPVTVNFRVIGGTAASNEYVLPPNPLTFDPGQQVKLLPLQIVDNNLLQPNRTIRLALYDPANATLDGIKLHTYTIIDDDSATVKVVASLPNAYENGTVAGGFRISRTGSTDSNLVVNYQVTGTASAPSDYAPLGTSVTIAAGATYIDLPVVPVDDGTVEPTETVVLTLISSPGARIVTPSAAIVTISDNDPESLPVVTVTSTNHPAAVEGGSNGEFAFFRTATNGLLTVSFTLAGNAVSGSDYVALPNSVTFADGQRSVSLPVVAIDDSTVKGERTLTLVPNVTGTYRVSYPSAATVMLQDNDQYVRIDASDFYSAEPGADVGAFTFSRFGTTNTALLVSFVISGSALNGIDYALISNSFTIPAGSLSATLPIVPLDDPLVEGPETVTLTLQARPGYSLGSPANATVTIMDDEPMFTVTATVPETMEGSPKPGIFTITRYGDPKYCVTAHLAVSGSATYDVDYPAFETNVFFSCGVTAVDLTVSAINELQVEGDEFARVDLLPDPEYSILAPSNAVIRILDAGLNPGPVVQITSPTVSTVYLLGTNANLVLEATVTDGGPNPATSWWSKVQGPDALVFGDTNQPSTTVSFTNMGVYVLRLTADDGQLQSYAELTVLVGTEEMLAQSNILYWALNDGSGTNALDSSGAGNHGRLTGNASWVSPGVLGGALSFGELGDSVRSTNRTSFVDGLRAFTLALWLRPDGTNTDRGLFCGDDEGTNRTLALYSKSYSSCCHSTNVIEATVATSRGAVRLVSANNAASNLGTNGWQHLAIVWSNGLAPTLYINGLPDQPGVHHSALAGFLTNCPLFIAGRGPAEWPLSCSGALDEVRFYPRALSPAEIGGLGATCCGNFGPIVDAGTNQTLQLGFPGFLAGTVSDDGRPNPPAQVITTWTNISGPVPVTIPDIHSLTNTVEFTQTGEYVFRLIADDSQVKTYDDVTLTVTDPTRVDVYASDPFAAELGPDTGEFMFMRTGDITYNMTVFFAFSGIASNGLDFVKLTNALTFPAGTDTLSLVVVPYLDHRTEGDQDVTITLLTNRAYTVGNGQASVIIQDSPFGQWTISHFTLEELTDPTLSAEGADFDHDGLVNLAEYAANLDPKDPSTNSPLLATTELDQVDGKPHTMLTYHRRLPPTDVGYAVAVSNDLLSWNSGTNYVQELSATDDGNGLTETVQARVLAPLSAATNQFVTVRVWLMTTEPANAGQLEPAALSEADTSP